MKHAVYQLFDKDGNFLYNVAITSDFIGLMRFKKDNNLNYKFLDDFQIDDNDLEKINDDLSKVNKKLAI